MDTHTDPDREPESSAASRQSGLPMEAAILVRDIKKYFGPTRALDGCSFAANLGEIHAIVGGNGCGKSTLAKVLSGVLQVDSGQVSVLGRTATTPHEARDIGLATVFQEVLVAEEASILDNLYMGADSLFSRALSMSAKRAAAEKLMMELTGEHIDIDEVVGTLPLGMKQWITIGRALLTEPRILILDESSAALDLDSTERLFAKMREMRDKGAAVLIVTHRIAELIRISDRATVLRDGRDVGVLEKQDITERNLLSLMTGHAPEHKSTNTDAAAALSNPVVLRASGLRLTPDSQPVSIDLHKGEILGVAGLDGQGQSEFVRILAGVQPAAEGFPLVLSRQGDFKPLRSLAEAVQSGVYFVSGDRKKEGIFANLSIFENMLLPLYRIKKRGGLLGLIDWKPLEGIFANEVRKLLIRMGARTNKITSLSGGNQQKVLIGRAFAMTPDIMVLNDPARGIDVGAKTELYRHLKDFAASGKAVIYMSSELEEFIGFASRVVVFRNASIFDVFDGDEIEPKRVLEAMFGQTSGQGKQRLEGRSGTDSDQQPGVKVRVAVGDSKNWRAASVDNPLRPRLIRTENPLKPSRPASRPEVAVPRVDSIKIVEFDAHGQRMSKAESERWK